MKRYLGLITIGMLLTAIQLVAAPARGGWFSYVQPDGTTVTVQLCGDEFHHTYVTEDGKSVMCGKDGYLYYTTLDAHNNLVASDIMVGGDISMLIDEEAVKMRHNELNLEKRQLKNRDVALRHAPMRKPATKAVSASSEVRGLIILVNFKDLSFRTSQSTINNMMNQEGYTDSYGSIGSARDYFNAQSYGQFVPNFDVVGPVTLSNNMSYYGGNDSSGSDSYPDVMVSEACQLASNQGLVDMSDYDLDGDGWVDLVYVIFAGHGENYSGVDEDAVWPHAWYVYQGAGRTVKIDGVYLDAYACSAELYGSTSTRVDGIGTFCHEYSHTLGLPDFYDIDYSGGMGMSEWSVMDQGCYAEYGYVPISYNSFERYSCGWITLNELTAPASVEMPDLNTDKTAAYRISSTNSNQYITLETRSQEGWDVGLPAEGVMVTAIDYDASVWNDNAPNDTPSRQRVKLIPADNEWSEDNLSGDLYPYGGNTQLTSSSSPAMKVYTTTIYDKPVTNITYSNGVANFDFMGGEVITVDVPLAQEATGVIYDAQNNAQFTANWDAVEGASSYTLYIERWVDKVVSEPEEPTDPEEPITPTVVFEEDFAGFTANSGTDISSSLDKYTSTQGWSGTKVFCNSGEAKLGSSSGNGKLTTPSFDVTADYTITFDAHSYASKDESGTLTITVVNSTGEATAQFAMSDLPNGTMTHVTVTGANGADGTTVSFSSTKRICIDNLVVTTGIVESSSPQCVATQFVGKDLRYNAVQEEVEKEIIETRTVEGITATEYIVTEVETPVLRGALYRYKVKAVTDEAESDWSNEVDVEIYFPTDVRDVTTQFCDVCVTNGMIHIESDVDTPITVYNMQGVTVAHIQTVGGRTASVPVMSGIYLVRCGDAVSKVIVR